MAQNVAPAALSSDLEFLGFRAGATIEDVEAQLATLGGSALRCRTAKRDERVRECRAEVAVPGLDEPVELWMSAISGTTGVLTLSSTMDDPELRRWRDELVVRFGEVGAKGQGTQWMMQWVRQRRMLRLTWRGEQGRIRSSVSLVDGRVLDGWSPPRR